jgi:hypothetical protein
MRLEAQNRLAGFAIWFIPLLWAANYYIARRAPAS